MGSVARNRPRDGMYGRYPIALSMSMIAPLSISAKFERYVVSVDGVGWVEPAHYQRHDSGACLRSRFRRRPSVITTTPPSTELEAMDTVNQGPLPIVEATMTPSTSSSTTMAR